MPNMQQMSLTEQVRMHGELLAKLTVLIEEDRKDLEDLKSSTSIIAKAMARQEVTASIIDLAKSRLLAIVVPLASTVLGILAGHFIR